MPFKPIPTRPPDPDRQEPITARIVKPISRDQIPVLPPKDSLAGSGQLKATAGKYRVIGVDLFRGPFADFLVADFADKNIAIEEAKLRARPMSAYYVYTDTGELVFSTR